MNKHLILIGFMGAGKTSVGCALAKLTDAKLMDTDQMIEELAGMTVSEIFAVQGEAAFRQMETAVLQTLSESPEPRIISTGGGLPMREENRQALRAMGTVVYLRVQPETVISRLDGDTTRPLLAGGNADEKVRELLSFRDPIYQAAAHEMIDTDGMTAEEIAKQIAGFRKK